MVLDWVSMRSSSLSVRTVEGMLRRGLVKLGTFLRLYPIAV
jgi:hypothetical protein